MIAGRSHDLPVFTLVFVSAREHIVINTFSLSCFTYIAHLTELLDYSSVLNYVRAPIPLHHSSNITPPDLSHFAAEESLAGVRRECYFAPNRRLSTAPKHPFGIRIVIHSLAANFRTVVWAACLTGFFSMLRSGNFPYKSLTKSSVLTVKDVISVTHGLLLDASVLRTAKSKGERLQVFLRHVTSARTLCPFIALQKLHTKNWPPKISRAVLHWEKNEIKLLFPLKFSTLLRSSLPKQTTMNIITRMRFAEALLLLVPVVVSIQRSQGIGVASAFANIFTRDSAYRHEFGSYIIATLSNLA